MNHAEALAARLQKGQAVLITSEHNRRYLTGFLSSDGCVVVTADGACFLTDFRYIEAARASVTTMECRTYRRMSEGVGEYLAERRVEQVYIEADQMPVGTFRLWQERLPQLQWIGDGTLDGWLREERLVKTPEELSKIRQAQALTEYGFEYILPFIRPGRTEREIALELERLIRWQGAERVAFDFIVVSGKNGALPHGAPSDKPVERGELITMDFGAVVDGWHSDMTRTVAVGAVSDEQRDVYGIVLRAQEAALAVLRAGLPCEAGDAAARDIIDRAGFGDAFGHSTGHGVGVEIHEAPHLSPSAGEQVLAAGSVVTVEPGIYLPGRFGVRIEDMALITGDGSENLTASPKELIVL